jgi:hypothetical protein
VPSVRVGERDEPSTGGYDDPKQSNEESQHGPESQEMGHVKRFKQRPQHGDIQFHGPYSPREGAGAQVRDFPSY